jgi:hypothetical protein
MTVKNKNISKTSRPKISKRLVAAAPDLLGACYSILITLEELELGDIGALKDVRKAISRATGKSVA